MGCRKKDIIRSKQYDTDLYCKKYRGQQKQMCEHENKCIAHIFAAFADKQPFPDFMQKIYHFAARLLNALVTQKRLVANIQSLSKHFPYYQS